MYEARLLNIGSGQRPFPKPWTNVDKVAGWNPDVLCDVGNPLETNIFETDSAQCIVLHHVLEHFGCNEGDGLLRECYRILNPVGCLIVCVPDLNELTDMWRERRISTQVYVTNLYGAYMGHEEDRHRWGYTRETLKEALFNAGFRHAFPFDFRDIKRADIAQARWVLALEATK